MAISFGIRFAIYSHLTKRYVSGKEYAYGPSGTRVMWSDDPKRARLFKAKGHAKNCAGYDEKTCTLVEVTLSAD